MNRLLVVAALLLIATTPQASAALGGVLFGLDAAGLDDAAARGVPMDTGTLWVGPWTLKEGGWTWVDQALGLIQKAGARPLIQFYYWGNDISPACVEKGCWSDLHQAWKDQKGWQALADGLAARLPGRNAIVILETEFNKNGIDSWEPFDHGLAVKAAQFSPHAKVVLGFGNWGDGAWDNFDEAMASSHYAGIQAMRASTRDAAPDVLPALRRGASVMWGLWGKPVFITDVAVSSYGDWEEEQAWALADLLLALPDLNVAGVAYRGYHDAPGATTKEYFGEAERHWGLTTWDGTPKPALGVWLKGVAAHREPPPPPTITEAEHFSEQAATGGWQANATASGGAVRNLWGDGVIAHRINTTAGTFSVGVAAMGRTAMDERARMQVRLDGDLIRDVEVPGGVVTTYWSRVSLAGGVHRVSVSFVNDRLYAPGVDRNLLVDSLLLATG